MRTRTLLVTAAWAMAIPVVSVPAQQPKPVDFTIRATAGRAYGDGGRHIDRGLNAFSLAMDFGRHNGGASGPLLGFGFSSFSSHGHDDFPCVAFATGTVTPCSQRPSSFPDIKLGYLDAGWRLVARGFRADLLVQPGVAFENRPDIVPVALGGSVSIGHRLTGVLGLEAGASTAYLPALDGERVGVRQLTVGLRSW
jgi:hypothetical protein